MDEARLANDHLTDAELFGLAAPGRGRARGAAAAPLAVPGLQPRAPGLEGRGRGRSPTRRSDEIEPPHGRRVARSRGRDDGGDPARRAPGTRPPLRWVVGIAAALAVVALAMPRAPHGARWPPRVPRPPAEAGLSAADRADDELLREASFLAGGGDDVAEARRPRGRL